MALPMPVARNSRPARKEPIPKEPMASNPIPIDITLNVLGYEEDGEWVALALEMDLRGYGSTFEEAYEDLSNLVLTQIRFAIFKGQSEMIWKPAEPIWFQRFAEVRRERLEARFRRRSIADPHYDVAALPVPSAHVIAALKADFSEA
jgi:hypothetical protein